MTSPDRLIVLVALAAAAWVVYQLAPILTPFLASALMAYVGDPLVDRLERLRLPRTLAVLAVFVLLFVALGLLTLLILPLVRAQVSALVLKLPQYVEWAEAQFLPRVREFFGQTAPGEAPYGLGAFLAQYGESLSQLTRTALVSVSRSGGAVLAAVASMLLVPVITFYMLRDWDVIMARLLALVPLAQRDTVLTLARESDTVLSAFLRGQLLVMFALALIYSVGLQAVGLDFALAIGVLAGLVSFVPYLGLVVGIALASVAALAQLQSLTAVGLVVVVFVVGQLIEGTLLTPKLVGDRIGLHPVLVIFAVMAGGQLFGFFGILLALPAAAVASVLVRFLFRRYGVRESGEGQPDAGARPRDAGGPPSDAPA